MAGFAAVDLAYRGMSAANPHPDAPADMEFAGNPPPFPPQAILRRSVGVQEWPKPQGTATPCDLYPLPRTVLMCLPPQWPPLPDPP